LDGTSENWAWWKWFEEPHKNWGHQTHAEIENGEFKKRIKDKVQEMLEKLDGTAL
jgi:hypothetical protein